MLNKYKGMVIGTMLFNLDINSAISVELGFFYLYFMFLHKWRKYDFIGDISDSHFFIIKTFKKKKKPDCLARLDKD